MKKQNDEINVKDLVGIFLPKLWVIVLCAVILSIILGAYAMFFKPDTYTSKGTVIVSRDKSYSLTTSDMELASRVIENLKVVVYGRNFLLIIAEDIADEEPVKALGEMSTDRLAKYLKSAITLTQNGNTMTFEVSATTSNPNLSRVIADSIISHIATNDESDESDESNALKGVIKTPAFNSVRMDSIEDPQVQPKNSKGVVSNIIIGFLVGALLSMVVVYIIAAFDVVIHDRKKLEDNFDIPVIGVIPRYDVREDNKEGVKANEG